IAICFCPFIYCIALIADSGQTVCEHHTLGMRLSQLSFAFGGKKGTSSMFLTAPFKFRSPPPTVWLCPIKITGTLIVTNFFTTKQRATAVAISGEGPGVKVPPILYISSKHDLLTIP